MSLDNKVLGKGLSALIPQNVQSLQSASEPQGDKSVAYVKTADIKDNRLQPRENYDPQKLDELKASIKEKGILQPLLVRRSGNGYEVVAGERRLRAARAINLAQVPVIIKDVTDREVLVLALIENMQREGLNPIEEARGFKRLMEEFNFTQEALAQSVGKDRSTVTNTLRLLRLPENVLKQVFDAKISVGHARALLSLGDNAHIEKVAKEIETKGLSVRQVEALVSGQKKITQVKELKPLKSRDIEILEEELRRKLGTKVEVADKKGKGKITIEYYNLDDLDRILGVLRK